VGVDFGVVVRVGAAVIFGVLVGGISVEVFRGVHVLVGGLSVGVGVTLGGTGDDVPVGIWSWVTREAESLNRGVRTVTVDSKGGSVGSAPQDVNSQAVNKASSILFLRIIPSSLSMLIVINHDIQTADAPQLLEVQDPCRCSSPFLAGDPSQD
jgi:hypothetical protein